MDDAANFLYCFQNDLPLNGATSQLITLDPAAERSYSHHVGARFDQNGVAQILENTFAAQSPFALKVVESLGFKQILRAFLSEAAQRAEIIDAFDTTNDPPRDFVWQIGNKPMNFSELQEPNLKFSLGGCNVENLELRARIQLAAELDNEGFPIGDEYYRVLNIAVGGVVRDLYDFDLEAPGEAAEAAMLQASFLAAGDGGHVYKNKVELGSAVNSWSGARLEDIWL